MPRSAREKSATGIYHIMLRGINRQNIFHDEEDKGVFLDRLVHYKPSCGFELYAYCLMDNHVHLLLKEEESSLSAVIRRLASSYVYWYNQKYERVGHLFQDRYKSEPVEDDVYLLTLIRYIHQNPLMVDSDMHVWTSYNDYVWGNGITDTALVLEMIGGVAKFEQLVRENVTEPCLDIEPHGRITDAQAEALIMQVAGVSHCQALQTMGRGQQRSILSQLKQQGLSIRQLERLTGISRGIIQRA